MGFFSWRCAKTGKPILAGERKWPDDLARFTKVVLVLKRGTVHGTYDGYGRIWAEKAKGVRIDDVPENIGDMGEEPRLVLAHAYAGEAYADLEPSGHEPNQGFFWSDDQLREVVADEYPYPRSMRDSAPATVARTLAQAGLGIVAADPSGRCWTIAAEPGRIAEIIAIHDALARSRGEAPAADPICAALRDLRDLVAPSEDRTHTTRCAGPTTFLGERRAAWTITVSLDPEAGPGVAIVDGGRSWTHGADVASAGPALSAPGGEGGPARLAFDGVLAFPAGDLRVQNGIGDVCLQWGDVLTVIVVPTEMPWAQAA